MAFTVTIIQPYDPSPLGGAVSTYMNIYTLYIIQMYCTRTEQFVTFYYHMWNTNQKRHLMGDID